MASLRQAGSLICVIAALVLIDESFTHSTSRHGKRHESRHRVIPAKMDDASYDDERMTSDYVQEDEGKEFRHRYVSLLTQNAKLREENRRLRTENAELISDDTKLVEQDLTLLKENNDVHEENERLLRNKNRRLEDQNHLKGYRKISREYDDLRREKGEISRKKERLLEEDDDLQEERRKLWDDERQFHEEKSQLYDESLRLHEQYERLIGEYDDIRRQIIQFHRCCLEDQDGHNTQGKQDYLCKNCSLLLRKTQLREVLNQDNFELMKLDDRGVIEDSTALQGDEGKLRVNDGPAIGGKLDKMNFSKPTANENTTDVEPGHQEEVGSLNDTGHNGSGNVTGNFSWDPKDRSKAFEHVMQVTEMTSCDKPIPQVFTIQDLISDKRRYYSPQATVLHRCGQHSGCCANEFLRCVPAEKELVELLFFMVRIEGSETFGPIVEKLQLTNHTKCGCVYKEQEMDYLD